MSVVPLSVLGNSASSSSAPLASEASIPPASEGSMLLVLTVSMPPVRIRFSIKDNITCFVSVLDTSSPLLECHLLPCLKATLSTFVHPPLPFYHY